MKKHILGVALFSLIVASFAFIYAFFYTPSIPSKESVKPPVPRTETRAEKPYACYPKRTKVISYTVDNASYLAEKNILSAKITLHWNGSGEPPKKISVQPRFFTNEEFAKTKVFEAETIIDPFRYGSRKSITLETKSVFEKTGSYAPNLYVIFDVTNSETGTYLTDKSAGLSEAFQVLYIYPNNSKPVIRGIREIPTN